VHTSKRLLLDTGIGKIPYPSSNSVFAWVYAKRLSVRIQILLSSATHEKIPPYLEYPTIQKQNEKYNFDQYITIFICDNITRPEEILIKSQKM
jgi:hypothetical protein